MNIIPDPAEARELRATYAGHPVIDEAEISIRGASYGLPGPITPEDAAAVIADWPAQELTDRERRAVVARFVADGVL